MDVPWSLEVLQLSWNVAYELLDKETYNLEHIQIDDEKNTFGVVQMLDMLISKVTKLILFGGIAWVQLPDMRLQKKIRFEDVTA